MKFINILFPVYNEELRLEKGIRKTIQFMDGILKDDYQLTIVDNASIDETPQIAERLCKEFAQVTLLHLDKQGVGVAFRSGVAVNKSPIVGYMDVDLSTDLRHLEEVIDLFRTDTHIGMVNGSRLNKKSDMNGRKWYRNLTSNGLTIVLKLAFGLKATDSICGFKFYRKDVVEKLIDEAGEGEAGWFYIIELLLRAERGKVKIVELPVHWEDDYNSSVKVIPLIKNYCIQIVKLKKKFRTENRAGR